MTQDTGTESPAATLWLEFGGQLRSFLRRRVPPQDVDDILQDVFLRIHRGLRDGEMPQNPVAWIHQVARRTAIDHYRSRKSDRSVADPDLDDTAASFERLESTATKELSRCIAPLLHQLPDDQREALTLTAFEGMTQVEAAASAAISTTAMKSRVQRARKTLAKRLLACCRVEFDVRGAPMDSDCDGCRVTHE